MPFLIQTFNILVDLLVTLIFLRVVLSWMIRERNAFTDFLYRCTEPILGPIRRMIPIMGGLDISPIISYFLLNVLRNLINSFFL